jgi:hypothetical protein
MRRYIFIVLLVIFSVNRSFAETLVQDCSFCKKDHQSICQGECEMEPNPYSTTNCHEDCIKVKCSSFCAAEKKETPKVVEKIPSKDIPPPVLKK